jgi:hypothetical protein
VYLRFLAVSVVAVLFALGQASGALWSPIGASSADASSPQSQRPASIALQDNGDADNGDNSDAASADNATADADNADNSDVALAGADNVDSADNAENADAGDNAAATTASAAPAAPPVDDAALKQPLTQVSGTSTGADSLVATPGERVAVRMFPWMPAGIQVTIRPADPNSLPAVPGARAGDLVFYVEALDAGGARLTALPAEVNLAIRYADTTIAGLNEQNLALSRLDPADNQWKAAPKLVREPDSNYVAASITQLGAYAVSAP